MCARNLASGAHVTFTITISHDSCLVQRSTQTRVASRISSLLTHRMAYWHTFMHQQRCLGSPRSAAQRLVLACDASLVVSIAGGSVFMLSCDPARFANNCIGACVPACDIWFDRGHMLACRQLSRGIAHGSRIKPLLPSLVGNYHLMMLHILPSSSLRHCRERLHQQLLDESGRVVDVLAARVTTRSLRIIIISSRCLRATSAPAASPCLRSPNHVARGRACADDDVRNERLVARRRAHGTTRKRRCTVLDGPRVSACPAGGSSRGAAPAAAPSYFQCNSSVLDCSRVLACGVLLGVNDYSVSALVDTRTRRGVTSSLPARRLLSATRS